MKLSEGKVTWPGPKQVWRVLDAGGTLARDVVELADADAPGAPEGGRVEPLLVEVMRDGEVVADEATLSLAAARERCARQLAALPEDLRSRHDFSPPPTVIGPALRALATRLRAERAETPNAERSAT
jgi:nicotinate phosphoribosyltransferase